MAATKHVKQIVLHWVVDPCHGLHPIVIAIAIFEHV